MFRSRKITVYEKKLIEAGINVKSMLGKNLLHRMIDVNYHHDTSVWSIDEYYYEGFDSEYNNGPNGWGYDFYPGTLSSPDDWKRVDS